MFKNYILKFVILGMVIGASGCHHLEKSQKYPTYSISNSVVYSPHYPFFRKKIKDVVLVDKIKYKIQQSIVGRNIDDETAVRELKENNYMEAVYGEKIKSISLGDKIKYKTQQSILGRDIDDETAVRELRKKELYGTDLW